MCVIKMGKDVVTKSDLQNLITKLILQKQTPFDEKMIINEAEISLLNSAFENTEIVAQLVKKTVSILLLNSLLTMNKGMYRATDGLNVV